MIKTILSILFVLGSLGALFMYAMPTYQAMDISKRDIASIDRALSQTKQMQDMSRALQSRYNSIGAEELKRLEHLLPDHVDNVRLVLDLDSIAARYGMTMQNVQVGKGESAEDQKNARPQGVIIGKKQSSYESMSLQFVSEGTYRNFTSLVKDVESSLRIVDLVALQILPSSSVASQKGEPVYRFTITLRTYWLKK
jgi:Tfp pilus assembly protein PilO